jgi:hypothetical protein
MCGFELVRLEFLQGDDMALFKDSISPDDIRQGNLGDCYLMCSLSSASESPDIVRRCFPGHVPGARGVSDVGLYHVRYCCRRPPSLMRGLRVGDSPCQLARGSTSCLCWCGLCANEVARMRCAHEPYKSVNISLHPRRHEGGSCFCLAVQAVSPRRVDHIPSGRLLPMLSWGRTRVRPGPWQRAVVPAHAEGVD